MTLHDLIGLSDKRNKELEDFAEEFMPDDRPPPEFRGPSDNVIGYFSAEHAIDESIVEGEKKYSGSDQLYMALRVVEELYSAATNTTKYGILAATNTNARWFLEKYRGRHTEIDIGVQEIQRKIFDKLMKEHPIITGIRAYVPLINIAGPRRS